MAHACYNDLNANVKGRIMAIHKNVSELIGNTPLVELTHFEQNHGLKATIAGKVEFFNPAGSIKDRIAKAMLDEAEAQGRIDADTVLIEPVRYLFCDRAADLLAAAACKIYILVGDYALEDTLFHGLEGCHDIALVVH